MTADLAVAPRPAVAERGPNELAPRHRARAATTAVRPSAPVPRPIDRPGHASVEEPSAARLRALLADPAVRVSAHRDDASARLVLRVVDRTTGEVIEQYPPDQLLRFYAALRETVGALFDEHA